MSRFPKITHVIFDLDGLLLDTEPIHAQVNQTLVNRYGKTLSELAKFKIAGRNAFDSAQILVEMLELPLTPQVYLQERDKLIAKLLPDAQPLLGAVRLTQHLYQHQVPQAIATSSSRRSFNLKTTHYQDWLALFDCIVLGDDPAIKQGKPAPDIFLLAAQRLKALPEQCLVFEDSLAGMEAACAAGMSVVAVPDLTMDKGLYQKANQVINSLADFEPQLWQLPPFELVNALG